MTTGRLGAMGAATAIGTPSAVGASLDTSGATETGFRAAGSGRRAGAGRAEGSGRATASAAFTGRGERGDFAARGRTADASEWAAGGGGVSAVDARRDDFVLTRRGSGAAGLAGTVEPPAVLRTARGLARGADGGTVDPAGSPEEVEEEARSSVEAATPGCGAVWEGVAVVASSGTGWSWAAPGFRCRLRRASAAGAESAPAAPGCSAGGRGERLAMNRVLQSCNAEKSR